MAGEQGLDPSAAELLVVVQTLLAAQELDDVRAATAHAVRLISRCDSLTLYELEGPDRTLVATLRHGDELRSHERDIEEILCARAAKRGGTVSTLDRLGHPEEPRLAFDHARQHGLLLARPLQVCGELIGVLAVHFAGRGTLLHREFDVLGRFVDFAAVALANARTREELRGFAYSDPLTGLGNRRRLDAELERLHGTELSLLLVDFDGLKSVNDTLGYERGDALIEAVAGRLAATICEGELAVRFGGDEFVVVLPGVVGEAAARRAEELTATLDACALPDDLAALFRGASVGFASAAAGDDVWAALIAASAAMRSRKRRRKTDRERLADETFEPGLRFGEF
jgi:diguanylate cyclase (GGDEF)-like protein